MTNTYDLFVELALMVSLGVIIYLIASALPRVSDLEEANGNRFREKTKGLGTILPLDQVDVKLNALKDKTLRRLKILVMKADNFLSRRLNNDKDNI